ncbi:MAG: hypothetical protein JW809_14725 [Pirellulales bacterium]|nr:hypothetical protein [Pirellulales bacterium]
MRSASWAWVSCFLAVGLLVAGCDRGPKLPPMANVSGTVTLDGKPVPTGTVQFIPDRDKGTPVGPPAVGYIDENGRFTLTTAGKPGALVGWHKIRVRAQKEGSGLDQFGNMAPSPWLIPIEYDNPNKSGLSAEVVADKDNDIPLELTSKLKSQ